MNSKHRKQDAEKRKREEAFNVDLDASQKLEPDAYCRRTAHLIAQGRRRTE